MAFITLKTPALSAEQKKRIGDRILYELQKEGIPPATVVLRYELENGDLYTDGTLVEAPRPAPPVAAPVFSLAATRVVEEHAPAPRAEAAPAYKDKARRSKKELEDLKGKLMDILKRDGSLSSFDAQKKLKLEDCDWAPNTLRRLFSELIEEGLARKEGEKRGTRYHWAVKAKEDLPPAKLVKGEGHE